MPYETENLTSQARGLSRQIFRTQARRRILDLVAGVAQGPGHDLGAAVVAVEAWLADHDAQRRAEPGPMRETWERQGYPRWTFAEDRQM